MSGKSGYRRVARTVTGKRAVDGAGVRLVRVVGSRDVEDFDPFLMLDAFDSSDPGDYVAGFPWHPHRGIETVTFLLEGEIAHGDSLGNKGSILSGGCQWMTAGSGIIHQEMPQSAPRMLGAQLWLNLPSVKKMTDPAYRDLPKEAIPVVRESGFSVSVIAGDYLGTRGAKSGEHVNATMLSIAIEPGAACSIPVAPDDTAFVYVFEGSLSFADGGESVPARTAALLADGAECLLRADVAAPVRCLFFAGKPLRESVAWGGPIVMNTEAELDEAFRELDEGTFVKHRAR
jgi:redox-sensitive bicupin YhaK (pirin superfamily)